MIAQKNRRLAALGAAGAVSLGLVFGGGVAFAADPPAPGTQACADQVNQDNKVQADLLLVEADQDALDAARTSGTTSDVTNAQNKLAKDKGTLAIDRNNASTRLCTGTTSTTTPTTTTPAPITGTQAPGTTVVLPPAVGADNVTCAFFADQAAAQVYGESHSGSRARLDRDSDGVYCEDAYDGYGAVVRRAASTNSNTTVNGGSSSTSTTVTPLKDDGSTASTSGSEIKTVPSGSVDTGSV